MGQGTDSCGGHDVDYDEYDEGLFTGMWTQRDGSQIHISKMTVSHMQGARRVAEDAARRSKFTDDQEKFEAWVDAFDEELARRGGEVERAPSIYIDGSVKKETRGAKAKMQCHCGGFYLAREADLARGWGLSCSKRCAAIRRDFNKPKAKRVTPCATNSN